MPHTYMIYKFITVKIKRSRIIKNNINESTYDDVSTITMIMIMII